MCINLWNFTTEQFNILCTSTRETEKKPLQFLYVSMALIHLPKSIQVFIAPHLFFKKKKNLFPPRAAIYIQLSICWKILRQTYAQPTN